MKLQLLQLGLAAYTLFRGLITGFPVCIGDPEDQVPFLIPIPTGSPQTVKLKAPRMKYHPR
jgi:hypothetical protein